MAGGHDNRDDPDLPKLRRFRFGPDGSTMAPISEPGPRPDDAMLLGSDEVSDESDESDLAQTHAEQVPATVPPRSTSAPGPVASAPRLLPPVPSTPTHAGPTHSGPAHSGLMVSHSAPGAVTGQSPQPGIAAPEPPNDGRRKKALWAAGVGAVVILLAAFFFIAKPFSDEPAPRDADKTSGSARQPTDRESGPAQASPTAPNGATPDRMPPSTGGLPAPGSPRPADPNKWATNVCDAITSYKEASADLSDAIDAVDTGPVANAKMVTIAEQSISLLTGLRASLTDIADGGGNKGLTTVQAAVVTAADDAATSIDPARPDNKGQAAGTFGDKVKEALGRPMSTLKSEVAKLDKSTRDTVTDTTACKPLNL